jgi:hypothetical protein
LKSASNAKPEKPEKPVCVNASQQVVLRNLALTLCDIYSLERDYSCDFAAWDGQDERRKVRVYFHNYMILNV